MDGLSSEYPSEDFLLLLLAINKSEKRRQTFDQYQIFGGLVINLQLELCNNLADSNLFNVNSGNTRTMCEICSKLTIENDINDVG